MISAITPMTVLLAFCAVVVARYFLTPLLREWPGDMPETEGLPRLRSPAEYSGALRRAASARFIALSRAASPPSDPTIGERLKLVVAVALGCDLCSYLYAQTAADGGADSGHVRRLLDGSLRGAPPEDVPLLKAARAFAAADAKPARVGRKAASPGPMALEPERLDPRLEAARFASLCCNTVLHYQRGRLDDSQRKTLYLVYQLTRPVEWLVAREAKRREMSRMRAEV